MSKCVFAAITAAGLCVAVTGALAQEPVADTAGGNVTADEATPLPPVVVQAPSEPIASRRKARPQAAGSTSGGAVPASGETAAAGTADVESPAIGVFTLGQLDVIGGSTITNEAMWTFNKTSLRDAVSIAPGVTSHSAGGRRNEGDIFVRGFDRFRVPLSIDGVRIYLPADNRLDMNRFLTPDLAEIQIQKGYVSVLNGPGGMGGAINMVSRKPTKEVELEGRAGLVMNGDLDDMNQWSSYAYAGTRQKGYYAQISGTVVDQDHFNLSDDFRAPAPSAPFDPAFPYETGGDRDNSDFSDWRINVKAGITPNATDEYSINYTTQSGEKSAPLHTKKEQLLGPQRYWEWPYWDITSVSWLSKTKVGDLSYVKTNAYYNTFENRLSSFDDATYGLQTRPYAFDSDYEDYAYGGFLEVGTELIPMNTLKGAIHYRRDNHQERNLNQPDTVAFLEPWQSNIEDTWSFALENTFHATKRLDFIAGVSYDFNDVRVAEDFNAGVIVQNETTSAGAWNYQGGAVYRFSNTGDVHATVSSRTRFPTVFERYSTRFGMATPNPDLDPERSTNYEIGVSETLFSQARVSGAVFYSDLKDAIQPVYIVGNGGRITSQNQNIDGEHYGFEVSVDWDIAPGLRVGGNYTYLQREYDYLTPGTRPEGTPDHEASIYLAWEATRNLTITPSLALASDRNAIITSGTSPTDYIETGAYALANMQAEYKFTEKASAAVGVTNIFDEDYALAEGFPEPGRQFFANARVRF